MLSEEGQRGGKIKLIPSTTWGGKDEEGGKKMVGADGDPWDSRDEWEDEGKEAAVHKRQCNNTLLLTMMLF